MGIKGKTMSNENNQDTPAAAVKRPRGNPNFGKKKAATVETTPAATVNNTIMDTVTDENGKVYNYRYVSNESDIWLKLYAAILGTYNSPGVGPVKQAASYADIAYQEYLTRYPK